MTQRVLSLTLPALADRPLCECHGEPMGVQGRSDKRYWRCRVKNREAIAAWRAANPEAWAAIQGRHDALHPQRYQRWVAANYEVRARGQARWRAANRENLREKNRRYRDSHREYLVELNRRWRAANPEKVRERDRRRRARKANVRSDLTPGQWEAVRIELGGRCVYCGGEAAQQDHDQPIARGGNHTRLNVVPSCLSCNVGKQTRTCNEWVLIMLPRLMREAA